MRAELLIDCRNAHGEGTFWSAEHRLVYWTDINGEHIWTFDPSSGRSRSYPTPGRVCCFATRDGKPSTEVIAAFADSFAFLDLLTSKRDVIASFEPEKPSTRLNDGRTDRTGHFVAGGMDEKALEPISSVWRLSSDLSLTCLLQSVACANSTCFSPDGLTMYFADSPTRELVSYAYDPASRKLGQKKTVATLPVGSGVPDGSCVDAEGFIWNAVWEGYRIERRAPDGRLDRTIDVPVKKPTCCTFGGDDLRTLFITTSRLSESESDLAREPAAGGLFAVKLDTRGVVDLPFGG